MLELTWVREVGSSQLLDLILPVITSNSQSNWAVATPGVHRRKLRYKSGGAPLDPSLPTSPPFLCPPFPFPPPFFPLYYSTLFTISGRSHTHAPFPALEVGPLKSS